MNNSLSFHPVFSAAIIFTVALLFLAFFVYREFQRKQKFLIWRIVALCLVMISLLGLLLRPAYQEEKKSAAVILLTKDYEQTKVDSIIRANPKLKIIRTRDASPYPNSTILKSWYELSNENISYVAGRGMPSHALDLLQNKSFLFIPALLPNGITQLIIPSDIYVNNRYQIRGTYNANEKTNLKLIGPGGVEDSVVIEKGNVTFSLSFIPKQTGEFIYSLVTEGLGGSIKERLPISVMPERQIRILIIQKFPTAEVRFLKNFLSEKNHQIVLRSQVSKNNFTYEYANATRTRIDNLRSDLLNSFDLLLIDQKSYDELGSLEKSDLKKAIRNGLGIILLLNEPNTKVLDEFLSKKTKVISKDTVHIRLSSRPYTFSVLPIELNNDGSIIAALKNRDHILSGNFFSGRGKIGFQFIQETYRLGIAGNADDYSSLWATLISNTARTHESTFKLKLTTPFPYYSNEPIDIGVISTCLQPSLYADSVRISMKENALVSDYWIGRTWAGKSGWHQFDIKKDSSQLHYFVHDSSEWTALKVSNQLIENRISQTNSISESKKITQLVPISNLLFYLIFLLSSAFLWLAPKI